MNSKTIIVFSIVLIIVVAIGFYYYGNRDEVEYDKGAEIKEETNKSADDAASNPLNDIPSANPYDDAVNPFEEAYTNPFE